MIICTRRFVEEMNQPQCDPRPRADATVFVRSARRSFFILAPLQMQRRRRIVVLLAIQQSTTKKNRPQRFTSIHLTNSNSAMAGQESERD